MSDEDKQIKRKLNNMLNDLKEIHIECGGVKEEFCINESNCKDILQEKVERYLNSKKSVRSKVELRKEILDSKLSPLEKQELVAKISDTVVKDAISIEIMERRSKARKQRKTRKEITTTNPPSVQEQIFEDKVSLKIKEQDQLLEDIDKGLSVVKELAISSNKQLTVQNSMLINVENKIDTTTVKLKSTNRKIKDMLEASGGCSRWCPMIMCSTILLGLIGTIFKLF